MKTHCPLTAEPSDADLAAIELEWPLIEAEMSLLDAEIVILSRTTPTEFDWQRLRRARRRVLREATTLLATPAADTYKAVA